MPRRIAVPILLVAPALGLAALGIAIVATAGARPGAPGLGAPVHFAVRQIMGVGLGVALGWVVVRAGIDRLLGAAPLLFGAALIATVAVFLPVVGVRAAGASRWLRIGPLSGNPAPFLIGATGILVAAWRRDTARPGAWARFESRPLALGLALLAVLVMAAEPDFSAAAVALAVTFAALAGTGVAGRRLVPAALVVLIALALGASRFGYVGDRIHGFLSPESDRRGHGFEVLSLARAKAAGATGAAGLGHGMSRRHLSSPASDYVFAVVNEELGRPGAWTVIGAWAAIAAGAALAARSAGGDGRRRGAAAACAAALLAPAALHIAVCRGWTPITGVTMPFLSYDPALTVASGGEIGVLVAMALAAGPTPPAPAPTAVANTDGPVA
jgi:cell division protein FtsW (lipid II flippase)